MIRAEKIGLVLCGGAAKGAYQIGCWKALRDAGISQFAVISGTSVGALNAVLIAMGDVEVATKLWVELSLDQILLNPGGRVRNYLFAALWTLRAGFAFLQTLNRRESAKVASLWLSQWGHLGSNRPLSRSIRKYVSVDKLRGSEAKVFSTESLLDHEYDPYTARSNYVPYHIGGGHVDYDEVLDESLPTPFLRWRPHVTEITSLPNDNDVVLALLRSANLPGLFRRRLLGNKPSIDGFLADNVPIYPVLRESCDLIIVIYLDEGAVPPTPKQLENLVAEEHFRREIRLRLSEAEAHELYQQFCRTGFPDRPEPPFSTTKSKFIFIRPSSSLGDRLDFSRAQERIDLGAKDTRTALLTGQF